MTVLADVALNWTISLIAIFVVLFGGLVNAIIVYSLVQAWGERKANEADRGQRLGSS